MGLFTYKHRKKIKLHILALPVLLLLSLFISIAAPQNVGAVTRLRDMTPDNAAKAFVYYKGLRECLMTGTMKNAGDFGGSSNSMTVEDALGYDWFHSGKTDVGVIGDTADGDGPALCGGGEGRTMNRQITTLTGYANGGDFLCSIGFTRQTGTTCSTIVTGSKNDFIRPASPGAKLDAWWQNAVGASQLGPSGIGAGEYMLYFRSFTKGCKAVKDTNGAYTIMAPSADGKTLVATKYALSDSGITGSTSRNVYAGRTMTCSQLAAAISGNDDAAVGAMKSWLSVEGNVLGNTDGSTNGDEESAPTCVIDQIGWILCPVLNFTAGIVDAAYGFVASLLVVQPILTTGESANIYNAWVVMRNIANIAFVIAFLIIIISQLTSVGISNYGVKKLLPRLVLVAILVNVSYWIAAIAVDASNILGASMNTIFGSLSAGLPTTEYSEAIATGDGWQGLVGGVLAGTIAAGALYYVGLSALIPALIAAFAAIVTVFLVLTLRQALIILLVVISPLAFVAYLLPNTEDLFTKWRKLLTTLLLMYPIIAAIFGASALASKIVMNSADGDYAIAIQIMGALIAILPLAITPIVMRTAGGVLNRFAGIVNNSEKGPLDRLRKAGEGYRNDRRNLRDARALNGANQLGRGAFVRRRARRDAIRSGRENELKRSNTEFVAGLAETDEGYKNAAAGGTALGTNAAVQKLAPKLAEANTADSGATQRILAQSISAQEKLEAEEVSAASIILRDAKLTQEQKQTLALGGSVVSEKVGTLNAQGSLAMRSAAMKQTIDAVNMDGINAIWDQVREAEGPEGDKLRASFANHLQGASYRPAYIGQGAIASLREPTYKIDEATGERVLGTADSKTLIERAVSANAYSPERLAKTDQEEIKTVVSAMNNASPELVKSGKITELRENAMTALTDPELSTSINKNMDQLITLTGQDPVRVKQVIKEARAGAPTVVTETTTQSQSETENVTGPQATAQPQNINVQQQSSGPQASPNITFDQPAPGPTDPIVVQVPPNANPAATVYEVRQQPSGRASGVQVGAPVIPGSGPGGVYVPGDRGFSTNPVPPIVTPRGPGTGPGGMVLPGDQPNDGGLTVPHDDR